MNHSTQHPLISTTTTDTLTNTGYVMAFCRDYFAVERTDFAMPDEAREGLYILLSMMDDALAYEVGRVSEPPPSS